MPDNTSAIKPKAQPPVFTEIKEARDRRDYEALSLHAKKIAALLQEKETRPLLKLFAYVIEEISKNAPSHESTAYPFFPFIHTNLELLEFEEKSPELSGVAFEKLPFQQRLKVYKSLPSFLWQYTAMPFCQRSLRHVVETTEKLLKNTLQGKTSPLTDTDIHIASDLAAFCGNIVFSAFKKEDETIKKDFAFETEIQDRFIQTASLLPPWEFATLLHRVANNKYCTGPFLDTVLSRLYEIAPSLNKRGHFLALKWIADRIFFTPSKDGSSPIMIELRERTLADMLAFAETAPSVFVRLQAFSTILDVFPDRFLANTKNFVYDRMLESAKKIKKEIPELTFRERANVIHTLFVASNTLVYKRKALLRIFHLERFCRNDALRNFENTPFLCFHSGWVYRKIALTVQNIPSLRRYENLAIASYLRVVEKNYPPAQRWRPYLEAIEDKALPIKKGSLLHRTIIDRQIDSLDILLKNESLAQQEGTFLADTCLNLVRNTPSRSFQNQKAILLWFQAIKLAGTEGQKRQLQQVAFASESSLLSVKARQELERMEQKTASPPLNQATGKTIPSPARHDIWRFRNKNQDRSSPEI